MNPIDQESREYPPCGYGLLGLCCSDCLRGPCRISPFEKTPALCGADPDLLVAGNLCRLAAKELARALKSLSQAAGEFRKRSGPPPAGSGVLVGRLARRYRIPEEEVIPFLEKETARLLDPLADQSPVILSPLLLESLFPCGQSERQSGSLPGKLSDLLNWETAGGQDLEALLWNCLEAAADLLAAEELANNLLFLLHSPLSEAQPPSIPHSPQPLVGVIAEDGQPHSAEMKRMAASLRETPAVLLVPLRGTSDLVRVLYDLQEEWHRPASDVPMVALVESRDLLSVLAPLALGLPTVSDPSLPIQGGRRVEDFFESGLAKSLGSFYRPIQDETALSRLREILESAP